MSNDKTSPSAVPPLPPIKHFQLDYILKNEVPQEVQQVVDSLLNVSANYRKDLKKEIRLKLSIEQKLQNKNIEISKLTRSLTKKLKSECSSISKQLNAKHDINDLDNEVLPVVELSASVSSRFKNIADKLQGKKLDASKFPNLGAYYSRSNANVPRSETRSKLATETQRELTVELIASQKDLALESPVYPKNGLIQNPTNERENEGANLLDDSANAKKAFEEGEEFDPKNFEQFMSETLFNYRKQQQKRYSNVDVFVQNTLDKTESQNLYDGPHFDNSLSSTYHKSENPLSLLASLSATKSPASVSQDLQISHFKKLRINGNPINSESVKKDCECNNNDSEAINSNNTTEATPVDQTSQYTTDLIGSPADSYSSVDPIIISSSEESETESENEHNEESDLTTTTNQYYSLLHDDYRNRKKKRKRRNKVQDYVRNDSPNPKHEPLHHKLKPKGSILKITNSRPRIMSKTWPIQISESKKVPKLPGVSIIGTQTINSIDNSLAQGIIVKEETDDNEVVEWYGVSEDKQIKSLNKLKTFVD